MATCLGVVLKTTPLRESDLLVQLFTDEHGRVSAVARGARKSQRRFAGALSLLVLARFDLGRRPRGDLWGLDSAEVVREWTEVSRDVVGVAHASYIAELVGAMLPPEAPDPDALLLILQTWDSLAVAGPSPGALRAVELALLDLAGHRPALDACAACGATDLETNAVFDPTRGGVVCRRCAATSRGPSVRPVDSTTLAYLRAVAGASALREASASDLRGPARDRRDSADPRDPRDSANLRNSADPRDPRDSPDPHDPGDSADPHDPRDSADRQDPLADDDLGEHGGSGLGDDAAALDELLRRSRAAGLAAARALDTDPRFAAADRAAGREAFVAMVSGLVGRPLRSLEYIAKLGAASRRDGS